jgi:putative acetyltransferase
MHIEIDDLSKADIVALIREHLRSAALHSPPESIHALDLDGLRDPAITFWSARERGELMGCGALKELSKTHGEIKSMRTATAHQRKGVASKLLQHILDEAVRRGYERISLETGTMEAFAPARELYRRFGFEPCPPFAQYFEDPYSVCMTKVLGQV